MTTIVYVSHVVSKRQEEACTSLSMYSHHAHGGGQRVGGHHTSRVIESLEKILNMYRQKCVDQNEIIASLKDQVRVLSENMSIKAQPRKKTNESRESPTSAYIQDLVENFEVLRRENEVLEAELRRVKKRLDIEEEWRIATLAWLESDWRVQVGFLHSHTTYWHLFNMIICAYPSGFSYVYNFICCFGAENCV